jgi:hypothetical protein
MAKSGGAIRNIFVWTYERGTLPYDILCALILAFIFFVPRSCFMAKHPSPAKVAPIQHSQPVENSSRK